MPQHELFNLVVNKVEQVAKLRKFYEVLPVMNFSHFYFTLTEVMACLYKAEAQSYISCVVEKPSIDTSQ